MYSAYLNWHTMPAHPLSEIVRGANSSIRPRLTAQEVQRRIFLFVRLPVAPQTESAFLGAQFPFRKVIPFKDGHGGTYGNSNPPAER